MFQYEHKMEVEVNVHRPDFASYLMLDREYNGTVEGLQQAVHYIRQSFMIHNEEFRIRFYRIAVRKLNDMEVLAKLLHQMHSSDDRYYDESNDDTPAFELIPPLKEEIASKEVYDIHINNDLTAAVMLDIDRETRSFHEYEEILKKLEDEGAKEVIRHLLHSCDTVVRELKDILNQLTTPQEHKDFGLGDSPNTWSHSSCNYFDKPNPLFTNPSEIKK